MSYSVIEPRLFLLSGFDAGGFRAGADGNSWAATLSVDGRAVLYLSTATQLTPGGDADGGRADLFFATLNGQHTLALTADSLLQPAATQVPAEHTPAVMFPFAAQGPAGAARYTMVFGSTSAAPTAQLTPPDDPAGARDLFLVTVDVPVHGAPVVHELRALTTGAGATPWAWSPDGTRIVFTSQVNLDGNPVAAVNPTHHALFVYDLSAGTSTRIASASLAFGNLRFGQDGTSLVFDSLASGIDVTGDLVNDVPGLDANGVSDVYLLRLGAGPGGSTLPSRVTADAAGQAYPSIEGSFVSDAQIGSLALPGAMRLTLTTDLALGNGGGLSGVYAARQVLTLDGLVHDRSSWQTGLVSSTVEGLEATAGGGRSGEGDRGQPGTAFTSNSLNLWGLDVSSFSGPQPEQAWFSFGGLAPILLSQRFDGSFGTAASGAGQVAPQLLHTSFLPSSLALDDGLWRVVLFESQADLTNVGATGRQLVLAAVPEQGLSLVLDYGRGGALNVDSGNGYPVARLVLNIPQRSYAEFDAGGAPGDAGPLSDRLRPFRTDEPLGLTLPGAGEIVLGGGSDRVMPSYDLATPSADFPLLPLADFHGSIDGGAGSDTLDIPSGVHTRLNDAHLVGFECIHFVGGGGELHVLDMQAVDGVLPAASLTGSAGADTLVRWTVKLTDPLATEGTLDLRPLQLAGVGGGASRFEVAQLGAFGLRVFAHPAMAMVSNGGTQADLLVGSHQPDTLAGADGNDTVEGGAGGDSLDGGDGHDVARYGSEPGSPGLTLDVAGLFGGGGGSSTGEAAGDTLVSIEEIRGSADGADLFTGAGRATPLVLDGRGGNDTVNAIPGDTVRGGAGTDVAVIADARAGYEAQATSAGVLLVKGSRVYTLEGVEQVRFDDAQVDPGQLLPQLPGTGGYGSVFNYEVGSTLNPRVGNRGELTRLELHLGNDTLHEVRTGADGVEVVVYSGPARPRASGNAPGPDTPVAVSAAPTGQITLGGGNDRVLAVGMANELAAHRFSAADIDAGAGFDVLVARGQFTTYTGRLRNVEQLLFTDPITLPSGARYALADVAIHDATLPFSSVRGYANTAVGARHELALRWDAQPGAAVLDLRGLLFSDFGGGTLGVFSSRSFGPLLGGVASSVAATVYAPPSVSTFIEGTRFGDTLVGGDQADTVYADNNVLQPGGNDSLDGGGGDDYLLPGGGDNTIVGGGGNDTVDGSPNRGPFTLNPFQGNDTAVFSGPRSAYTVQADPLVPRGPFLSGPTVFDIQITDTRAGSPDGSDVFEDIEFFRFADGTFTLAQMLAGAGGGGGGGTGGTNPVLSGNPSVNEGATWSLGIQLPAGTPAATRVQIQWGDGTTDELTAAALQAQAGQVAYAWSDGAGGIGTSYVVTVRLLDAQGAVTGSATRDVRVLDTAPRLQADGPPEATVGAPWPLQILSAYVDDGLDDLQELRIDWGDGSPLTVVSGAQGLDPAYFHTYTGIGRYTVRVSVRNDDGMFPVDSDIVDVRAATGAAQGQTAGQLASQWLDPGIGMVHTDQLAGDLTAWSPLVYSTVGGGTLAGGDLFILGGLGYLGVSGRVAATSDVAQEIDGTEALRIDYLGSDLPGAVRLDLGFLFADDAPGLHESVRVELYAGSWLVHSSVHRATDLNGALALLIHSSTPFSSVVLSAGALDAQGQFVFGALADAQGQAVPAAAGDGSEFMVEAVGFLSVAESEALQAPGPIFGGG